MKLRAIPVTLAIILSFALATEASDQLPFETWDATTLDVHGELKTLNGQWQHSPSDDLDRAPDFRTH